MPKEGKSFTSANLAQVIVRQHGRRVLLLDADLRNPQLHHYLGAEPGPGLSEYLRSESDEFSIIQRGPMENLFLIPAGHNAGNPAELLANGRLKFLLSRLETMFDWIIVDSAPGGSGSRRRVAGDILRRCSAGGALEQHSHRRRPQGQKRIRRSQCCGRGAQRN